MGGLNHASAASFSIDEPTEVPVGGSLKFVIATESGEWPAGFEGAEQPTSLFFNGPCTNLQFYSFFNQYGIDFNVTFTGPGWSNSLVQCITLNKPGSYTATFSYHRLDASGLATLNMINVPFTVKPVKLNVSPTTIATGDTVLIGLTDHSSTGDPVSSLVVQCPDGTTASVNDVSVLNQGFSVIWPGPFFSGECNSSDDDGVHSVSLTTLRQTASKSFGVEGDTDGDGWNNIDDNCDLVDNPGQEDTDGDGLGDACDPDSDNDGTEDSTDNCPSVSNPGQEDSDSNGVGDACETDHDNDGIDNAIDNCPSVPNPNQLNSDGDEFGDVRDPDDFDSDNDGLNDDVDNCPNVFNPAQQDLDGDGIGTACDPDLDGDGVPNTSDPDIDADGLDNEDENLVGTDPESPESLGNGINMFSDGNPVGSNSVTPGQPVGVVVNPGNSDVDAIDVTVIDPAGNTAVEQTLVPHSPVGFVFHPDSPGTWTVHADLRNGTELAKTFEVNFFVLPESPIGILALVTSSLAVLGGFMFLRSRRNNSTGQMSF